MRKLSILAKLWHRLRPYCIGRERHARLLGVAIGADCRIYISEWGSEPFLITIGDRVTITDGVRLLTHDGSTWLFRNADGSRYQRYAPVVIGDRVFIGCDAIVLPGVSIGDDCVIGAGAVVTKDVPSGTIAAGNPARAIGKTDALGERIAGTCPTDADLAGHTDYRERVQAAIAFAQGQRDQ